MTEFQRSFRNGLRAIAFAITLSLTCLVAFTDITNETVGRSSDTAAIMLTRPDVPHGPMAVLAKHEANCWTGPQPKDVKVPGALIWQRPNGTAFYSTDDKLVARALDTVFWDGDLPGNPVAFCR